MSEKIEPALSAEEWRDLLEGMPVGTFDDAAAIALANHSLADDDPRKITRERIETLRSAMELAVEGRRHYRPAEGDALAFLDALESYLPPAEP